jgi:endonuclease/exonuclease/phosphatase family metal-dependent hydrolase
MNRRIAFTLVPLAYLTLSCGQPVSFSKSDEPQRSTATARQEEPTKETQGAAKPKQAWPADGIAYGRREPLPKKPGTLRIATYNLENLFDDKDDPSVPPAGMSTITDDKTMHVSPARLEALAATIRRLDADVLALQEIEGKDALVEFRDRYLKGLGYEHLASVDAGDPRGIEQAVLSRLPITKVENWPERRIDDQDAKRQGGDFAKAKGELPKRWARSPLVVTVKSKDGYELDLLVLHHKSGGGFDVQRELEALEVIEVAKERLAKDPQRNLAILGDFNATPTKKSVKLYRENGFVNAYDHRFDAKAPSETYITHATKRPIDFIWMSEGLAKDVVQKSFFVLGTPVAQKLPPMNASAEEKEKALPKGYASDHLPVAIDITPKD